jgi:hypothetical protein
LKDRHRNNDVSTLSAAVDIYGRRHDDPLLAETASRAKDLSIHTFSCFYLAVINKAVGVQVLFGDRKI